MTRMKRFLALIGMTFAAQSATAAATDLPGTYVVASCALGDQPIGLTGWSRNDPPGGHLTNTCDRRWGVFSVSYDEKYWSLHERYGWKWQAPKDAVVAGVRIWGYSTSASGIAAGVVAGSDSVGFPATLPSPVEALNFNSTTLEVMLECLNPDGCLHRTPPPGYPGVQVSRMEILLRDVLPPEAVGQPTGTLTAGGRLQGVVSAGVDYRDRGGGVRAMVILVDGNRAAESVVNGESCRQPSAYSVPCPLSGRIDVEVDTAKISDGEHRVELELRDVAGNRTLLGPYQVEVRNSPAPQASVPLTPGRLVLRRYSARARYGARAAIEGSLVDFEGLPIAGAQIEVASRPLMRDGAFSVAGPVLTDGSGRFIVPVPIGPSRTFRLRYAASEVSGDVIVPAPVKLRASPKRTRNGKSVRFTGTIPGTDAGTRVELQARAGRRWVPFRTATFAKGRFSARYRFTNTRTTQRYSFRAVVRKDPNFPYAAATSRIVKVVVRP
jgi:hypothetical protein